MDDIIIKGTARTMEMEGEPTIDLNNTFRIYRIRPGAIGLQIRSKGPICHKGKTRRITSHIEITESDFHAILTQLAALDSN